MLNAQNLNCRYCHCHEWILTFKYFIQMNRVSRSKDKYLKATLNTTHIYPKTQGSDRMITYISI